MNTPAPRAVQSGMDPTTLARDLAAIRYRAQAIDDSTGMEATLTMRLTPDDSGRWEASVRDCMDSLWALGDGETPEAALAELRADVGARGR